MANENSSSLVDLLGDEDIVLPASNEKSPQLHNLEKLQEAHDKLLHELEEKQSFISKLHSQLDQQIDVNDDLQAKLNEKEQDLATATAQINAFQEEKKENEATILKLKQLAVKLKKELADAKEELDKSKADQSSKDLSKSLAKENEKLSNLYQSTFRNFHNLQADLDKLQDEHDQLSGLKKQLDQDLHQAASELSKTRFQLSEAKQEIENLTKEVSKLKKETEVSFTKRKEAEGKVIVLTNEVAECRKKLENQAGLERTVNELRSQLSLKTTEIVELSDIVEKSREVESEVSRLTDKVTELEEKVISLKDKNEELEEENWKLTRKLETSTSTNENERLRLIEQKDENSILREKLEQVQKSSGKQISDLKSQFHLIQKQLATAQADLSNKEAEFCEYKTKVSIVLSQRNSNQSEVDELKKSIEEQADEIQILTQKLCAASEQYESERTARSLLESENKKLENQLSNLQTQISSGQKECEALKSLSRDLQSRVVSLEAVLREKEKQSDHLLEETKLAFTSKISDLQAQIAKLESELNEERASKISDVSSVTEHESTTLMVDAQKRYSLSTRDEVDSLASTSLTPRTRNFSISSTSCDLLGHPVQGGHTVLDEILNPKPEIEQSTTSSAELERIRLILEDSEANNALLNEQIRVLKEEIRRLERTIARTEAAHNLEYLKNILVKFVSAKTGSTEKAQLIPVIKTLLKLDQQEEVLFSQSVNPSSNATAESTNSWSNLLWR